MGILVTTNHGYGRGLLAGVTRFAETRPAWQCVLHTQVSPENLRWLIAGYRLDGLICEARSQAMLEQLYPLDYPVVVVTGIEKLPPHPHLAQVIIDQTAIGQMAFQYFKELGFRSFAFYPVFGNTISEARGRNFADAVEAAGFECHWCPTDQSDVTDAQANDLRPSLVDWLASLPTPIALFAGNDEAGVQVIRAARLIGRQVPEEIAILGVDNDELVCQLCYPPLSSINPGTTQVGFRAASVLDDMMNGATATPPQPATTIHPQGVVRRRSTDTLVIDDENVREALRFIRANACNGLNVKDVLKEVAVSRRKLEILFNRRMERTIQREIFRTQCARAAELLAHTDMQTPDVAAQCGFPSASRLSVVFKREFGLTPTAYRTSWQKPSARY